MTLAYLYHWKHLPSQKWYIGSRTAQGCHPDDGYICSSKIVKPLIKSNPTEWHKTILVIGDPDYIWELEHQYLTSLNARKDPQSFNLTNGQPVGRSGVPISDKHKKSISEANKGKIYSEETLQKISENVSKSRQEKPITQAQLDTLKKMSEKNKGSTWTEERRQKFKKSIKERYARQESKLLGKKRKPFSDETRRKMSEARRRRITNHG